MKITSFQKMLPGIFFLAVHLIALQAQDTNSGRNIYHPPVKENEDSANIIKQEITNYDSIARANDSILAREKFIFDSLTARKRIIDSLNFLKVRIQDLLEAYSFTGTEEVISGFDPIRITGDSVLGDFVYYSLPFGVKDPYIPWKNSIPLSGKQVKIKAESDHTIFQTPRVKATFIRSGNLVIIQRQGFIQNSQVGPLYKLPVDSVFYDRNNRITKVKNFILFYSVINSNQRGNLLFTNRVFVRQYEYAADGKPSKIEMVKFCDRLKAYESNKVCSIITYTLSCQGNTWMLTRKNNPVNSYSDGTFTFLVDEGHNISSISFANEANTEKWQRTIELNKDGNVNCYFDKSNDILRQSLCMIYHTEAGAKIAVETITTIFEKDGISYFQRNNTTGKVRTRDKMTLEWTPWHNEN